MKITMDERVKHRVIGFAVIFSLSAIFAPAIFKKSQQHFDEKSTLSIRLPTRPVLSKIQPPTQDALLHSVKKVALKLPVLPKQAIAFKGAKASPLKEGHDIALQTKVAAPAPVASKHAMPILSAQHDSLPPLEKAAIQSAHINLSPKSIALKNRYAVQVAIFAEQANAIALVNRLKNKGYTAKYEKNKNRYRVTVGPIPQKEEALNLQRKLVEAMQIKGFVIPVGLS